MTARRFGSCAWLVVSLAFLAAACPTAAHHMKMQGPIIGVPIPAIGHGEMPVFADYRAAILELAQRQPLTDPTLRRLAGFVSLQYFACFRGLMPGSLSDDASPFNECSHAYLAGTRALLVHLTQMAGDQSRALALQKEIEARLASDPASSSLCSASQQIFDSAVIVSPDWAMMWEHPPTVFTLLFLILFVVALIGLAFRGFRWLNARSRQEP